jgi:hypothetical protein
MHLVVDKNKDLAELNPGKLEQLPRQHWERLCPRRPASPVDYHEEIESLDDDDDRVLRDFDPNPAL